MSEDKTFEKAKKELKKLIGKSKLSKKDKQELGKKINEATTPEMVAEIMKDTVLDAKKGLGEKIKDAVKGKPKESKVDSTMVQNGIRAGVNDPPQPPKEKPEKPKHKPRPAVTVEACPKCGNGVIKGKCINKNCDFDPTKPLVKIPRVTTSTIHKSQYPAKR